MKKSNKSVQTGIRNLITYVRFLTCSSVEKLDDRPSLGKSTSTFALESIVLEFYYNCFLKIRFFLLMSDKNKNITTFDTTNECRWYFFGGNVSKGWYYKLWLYWLNRTLHKSRILTSL